MSLAVWDVGMRATLSAVCLWLWHLLPANPILTRVVLGASRRVRHLWLRFAYLAILLLVVLISLINSMTDQGASLSDLAMGASQTFKWASTTQLALMCFLAPVFTASAITQERDAQTFNILLSTPLTSAQIVFGSLMSRLYFVLMLLVAGLPIFLMTMVYGGVTAPQIWQSFALSGATAVLTGALAIFVAMTSVGTKRTIFSFYVAIGLYLLCVYLLGLWDRTWIESSAANIRGQKMSWLTPLHPFLALDVALNRVHTPPEARLMEHTGLVRFALAYPAAAYVTWTVLAALALTVSSIFFVRRGAKTGEPTIFTAIRDKFYRPVSSERTRPPRTVWSNPVAWREAKTKAVAGGILRLATILGGLTGAVLLFVYHAAREFTATEVARWLAGLTVVQFALVLIIATNTAATSITKEREALTLDLLLTTPLTSKYILWGKLRGLVSFAAPLVIGPVVVLVAFAIYGWWSGASPPAVWIETGIELGALMVIYTALACVLGLRVSLTSKTNVSAVMYGLGLLIVLCGIATSFGLWFVDSARQEFGAFVAPFTPFTAILYLIDPSALFDSSQAYAQRAGAARLAAFIGCAAAAVLFAFIAWQRYSSLVREFDMTMRKQSSM